MKYKIKYEYNSKGLDTKSKDGFCKSKSYSIGYVDGIDLLPTLQILIDDNKELRGISATDIFNSISNQTKFDKYIPLLRTRNSKLSVKIIK